MWPVLFDQFMGFLILMEVFSGAMFIVNKAWFLAGITWLTLTPPLVVRAEGCCVCLCVWGWVEWGGLRRTKAGSGGGSGASRSWWRRAGEAADRSGRGSKRHMSGPEWRHAGRGI